MDGPGDELLARPALPQDQDRGGAGGRPLDQVEGLLHAPAGRDDEINFEFFPQLFPELLVLPAQAHFSFHPLDQEEEFVQIDGFGQVVIGSLFHGLHRGFHRPESCQQDDHHLRVQPLQLLEELNSVHPRHSEVRQNQVEGPSFDSIQGSGPVSGRADSVSLLGQKSFQHFPLDLLVIDDQDLKLWSSLHPTSPGTGKAIRKIVPWPATLSTSMVPPWSWMILWARGRPNPIPFSLVVK